MEKIDIYYNLGIYVLNERALILYQFQTRGLTDIRQAYQ